MQQAAEGSCAFYDCFEQRYPCGNCGFNKHYSTYDCEKFYQPVYYNQFNELVSVTSVYRKGYNITVSGRRNCSEVMNTKG